MNATLILKLFASLLLTLGLGAVAGMVTAQAVPEWYNTLNRPSFSPPNWIFGPVWTLLYIMLGVSFFIIWKLESGPERNVAMGVFLLQLLFNFCWSIIFFHFRMIGFALIDIVALWICIAVMLFLFYRIKPMAAYINIPYFLWVTFASALNGAYYFLNKV